MTSPSLESINTRHQSFFIFQANTSSHASSHGTTVGPMVQKKPQHPVRSHASSHVSSHETSSGARVPKAQDQAGINLNDEKILLLCPLT